MGKELTIEALEQICEEIDFDEYPKYIGNGLFSPAPGVICGKAGMDRIVEMMRDEIRQKANQVTFFNPQQTEMSA